MALFRNLVEKLTSRKGEEHKISYSQCGEDLIVDFVFKIVLGVSEISYLDIGAYHPTDLNNTYLFYSQGHQGVCVEPDPVLFEEIKRIRPRDTCLTAGVGGLGRAKAEFYRMTTRTLNTFSRAEAERYQNYGGQKIEEVLEVPMISVNTIIEDHFPSGPSYVSLDVEGLDLEILKSFDFGRYRPSVFCVETLTYTEDRSERKLHEIIEFMSSQGYFVYADTYINTIFVDRDSWARRQ